MSNVVVKQGKPSAPGTVVDTSAAKVVPASSEVRTEAATREVAAQGKASQAKIGAAAKKMTHPARAKDEAVKAGTSKGSTKANQPQKRKIPRSPHRKRECRLRASRSRGRARAARRSKSARW